jgi:UDP-glucose 4-epimerase
MRQLVEVISTVTGRQAVTNEIKTVTEDTYRLVADISKLESLGYRPRVALTEGIRELARGLGENPELPSGATIFKRGQKAEE